MTTTTGDAPPDPDELEPLVESASPEESAPPTPAAAAEGGADAAGPAGPVDRRQWITAGIVAAVTLFVVWNLRPWVWFIDSTPTGGDLGAHVWSPAYLRDVLLPDWRLTGWTPDWYAGFPAFTFYMVVPSLLVVIINVGLDVSLGVVALMSAGLAGYALAHRLGLAARWRIVYAAGAWLVALGLSRLDGRDISLPIPRVGDFTYSHTPAEVVLSVVVLPALAGISLWRVLPRAPWRGAVTALAVVLVVLAVPIPYGVALKLVVVSGLVTLPVAAWAAGRLGGLAFPGPALMAVMTLPFIFDRSYNIYGGNLMSTMAGEFAYSIGLTLAVLYIGVMARGLETGRHRGIAAVLLALTGLTHLFPAFFAIIVTGAMLLVRFGRRSFSWIVVVGPLAGLLSAFWVLPFVWNTPYLNDMGWGKERRYVEALWSRGGNFGDQTFLDNDPVLQVFVVLAIVGAVLSGLRRVRLGMALSITAMAIAGAFLLLPETRLWNVRILPFYYLTIYLLAAIAVAELSRLVFGWRPSTAAPRTLGWRTGVPAIAVGVVVLGSLAVPLRSLPFGGSDESGDHGYAWSGGVLSTSELNLGPYWLSYNFRGYEDKDPTEAGGGTAEYTDMVATMAKVGEEQGCGRALWEYESGRLGSYGTTMAPMLLPHWTDGCIASMEGLYFEASATTPYHFLLQSELSTAPSRAQRDLPYDDLDVGAGVAHLQTLGVRYYMAFSEAAVAQARAQPELTEIAASGPWVVFVVADSDLVEGLDHLPVVMDGTDTGGEDWLVPSVASWGAGDAAPLIAADGPEAWPRVDSLDTFLESTPDVPDFDDDRVGVMRFAAAQLPDWLGRTEVVPVEVSDIVTDEQSISFSVDEPGSPVLVRASYFPNWTATGADGPYRVAPNLMVVVPTDTEVELNYGRSSIEWISILLTVVGLATLFALGRAPIAGTGRLWTAAADHRLLVVVRTGLLTIAATTLAVALVLSLLDQSLMAGAEWATVAILALLAGAGLERMRRGRGVLWDLAAESPDQPDRVALVAALRSGALRQADVAELQRAAEEERASSLRLVAVGVVLVGVSLLASGLVAENTERPFAALAVWLPAALGLILLAFDAVPRLLTTLAYRRWTLAPAELIAELLADVVPDREPPGRSGRGAEPGS